MITMNVITMNVFAIAIRAFDPTGFWGYLQPDAWVAQGPFAAVTGDVIPVNNLFFRHLNGHRDSLPCCLPPLPTWFTCVYDPTQMRGQ